MKGMESILAMLSTMGWLTQPSCSWPRHNSEITALAWRPGGYLAMVSRAHCAFSAPKAKLAGWISGGARRRSDMILLCEIDAADQPVLEGVNRDDLELLAARSADHQFVIHHTVADGDTVLEDRPVLGKLGEGLGIARLKRFAAGFGRCAVEARHRAIGGEEGDISLQVLGVVGVQLFLGDIDIGICLHAHRSTSPNTISSEPSTADTSASIWPLHM